MGGEHTGISGLAEKRRLTFTCLMPFVKYLKRNGKIDTVHKGKRNFMTD